MEEDPRWKESGLPLSDLEVDLLMYQDDLFLWETTAHTLTLELQIRLIGGFPQKLGLQLAAKKTAVCTPEYTGLRVFDVEGERARVQPSDEPIKVLGLKFSFEGDQSRQAREVIGRVRAAFGQHREILRGKAGWHNKVYAVKTLLEGVFARTAAALYWSTSDLAILNTLQLHILRDAFQLRRYREEEWYQWNHEEP
eukprot:s2540_g5.t1